MAKKKIDIQGSRDLTLLSKCLEHAWDIPAEVMRKLPKQLSEIALGKTKMANGNPWSTRARMNAAKLLLRMNGLNTLAGRLDLDAWKAQQPGSLSVGAIEAAVDRIAKEAFAQLGNTPEVQLFAKQIHETILHAARLEHGTSLLPGEVDETVIAMDGSIPDELDEGT